MYAKGYSIYKYDEPAEGLLFLPVSKTRRSQKDLITHLNLCSEWA